MGHGDPSLGEDTLDGLGQDEEFSPSTPPLPEESNVTRAENCDMCGVVQLEEISQTTPPLPEPTTKMKEGVNCEMCGSLITTSRCRRCATVLCGECWNESCLCLDGDSFSKIPEVDSLLGDEISVDVSWSSSKSEDENAKVIFIENGGDDVMSDILVNLQAFILDSKNANGTEIIELVSENDTLSEFAVDLDGSVTDNGFQFPKYCKIGHYQKRGFWKPWANRK